MKIASFNVNSIRARMPIVSLWLRENNPDILCLQETKVQDHEFPVEALEKEGYHSRFRGQKSYNGVAVFSRKPIETVSFGLPDEPQDQPRLIRVQAEGVNIVNTYIPQGYMRDTEKYEYKLMWLKRLRAYFENSFRPTDKVIWTGDFNVALDDRDVHDPEGLRGHVCFNPQVQQLLREITDWGFTDTFRMHTTEGGHYSFWDYRAKGSVSRNRGWRLDYIMATAPMAEKCRSCIIDKQPRLMERPSDHTPVVAEFLD